MATLCEAEYQAAPSYLASQLSMPLDRANEAIDAVNDLVTERRFKARGMDNESLTAEDFASLLRLGSRTKTFILLLLHLGKLRGLDTPAGKCYRIIQ